MDPWALLTQVQSNIGATCDRAIRQTSLIEARERDGLSTEHERNVLRGMRVSLGLEYHHQDRLLAVLTGEILAGEILADESRIDESRAGESLTAESLTAESSSAHAPACRRAPPARRACHRGAGADCPLPIRCCQTLAATLTPWSHRPASRLPLARTDPRSAPAAVLAASCA